MLEHIDEVDWSGLRHAYGRARDVPGQVRALRSVDPEERARARHQLYGNIYHQGTRFEATAFAVPFLLEVLADPSTSERADLLDLLGAITVGFDESWLPNPIPIEAHRRDAEGGAEVLARTHEPREDDEDDESDEDDEFDEDDDDDPYFAFSDDEMSRHWAYVAVAAYDAVRAGGPLYRELLSDHEAAVRARAAYLLGWFPEDAAANLPALAAAAADDDDAVAATALVSTGLLGGDVDPARHVDPRPTVRWGAAIARARVGGAGTEQSVVDELHAWAGGSSGSDPRVPFLDGDLGGYAGLALGQVGDQHLDDSLASLLRRLPHTSRMPALAVVSEALRRAFPQGAAPAGTPFAALDERQQRVVRTIAASRDTWLYDGMVFGNLSQLIHEYGLPNSPDGLAAYVAA